MKKRVLSALMVLCMVLTLLPVSAFAAPTATLKPGEVSATKTAQYDENTGNVTITLNVQGKNITETSTTATPVDVVLVVDNSGSMSDGQQDCTSTSFTRKWYGYICDVCGKWYSLFEHPEECGGHISKMSAAQEAARTLVDQLAEANTNNRVGIVSFAGSTGGTSGYEFNSNACIPLSALTDERDAINQAIDNMTANGGTNYTAGLDRATGYLQNSQNEQYVIFISDGTPGLNESSNQTENVNWNGVNQAAQLKAQGVEIYTIGLGLDESEYMSRLATAPEYHHNFTDIASIQEELPALVREIATEITESQKYAGTEATFTDIVSDQFTIVEGQNISGLTFEGQTVEWTVGDITEEGKSVSFIVTPKDTTTGDGVSTNQNATLTYTKPDGTTGTTNVDSAVVNIPGYQVTYNANTGEGTVTDSNSYRKNAPVPVLGGSSLTKDGATFLGWSRTQTTLIESEEAAADVEFVTGTLTITDNITLFAVWAVDKDGNGIPDYRDEKFTVTYTDGVADEEIFPDQVYSGRLSGTATPAFSGSTPTRANYIFAGWDPTVEETVNPDHAVDGVIMYTATWKDDKNNNDIPDEEESKYTVTYTDGVEDEEVFKDQKYENLLSGDDTPAFKGTPEREGWNFALVNKNWTQILNITSV